MILPLVRIRSAPGLSRVGSTGCWALTIAAAAPMRSAIALPARNRLLSMARDRSTRRNTGQSLASDPSIAASAPLGLPPFTTTGRAEIDAAAIAPATLAAGAFLARHDR